MCCEAGAAGCNNSRAGWGIKHERIRFSCLHGCIGCQITHYSASVVALRSSIVQQHCSVTARSATTATPKARVTRLGLLLFSAILACALLNSVAAIGPEAGVRPGSASVAATAAATVSTPLPTTPQLDRQLQAERQHRVKEQRSASMPQAQRRVKNPQHGEGDARTRVLGVLVLLVMVPLVVVVETVRSM